MHRITQYMERLALLQNKPFHILSLGFKCGIFNLFLSPNHSIYDVNLEISVQPEKVESGITSGIFTACHIALVGDGLSKQPMIGFGFEMQAQMAKYNRRRMKHPQTES